MKGDSISSAHTAQPHLLPPGANGGVSDLGPGGEQVDKGGRRDDDQPGDQSDHGAGA